MTPMFIVTLKAVASISQRDVPTIRGNCPNSASVSDHRCPQIVISFKLLSGKVQVKDIFTLSFPVITWVLFGVISLWMDVITHVQCIWEA